jgi:excisionase family DNA binding protein
MMSVLLPLVTTILAVAPPTAERVLTVREAVAVYSVPERWLRTELRAGRVPCLRSGRSYLLVASTFEAWLRPTNPVESQNDH